MLLLAPHEFLGTLVIDCINSLNTVTLKFCRYLTQPTETESPEKSPDTTRKMKYGAVRHRTQPVTPEEKREAEAMPDVSGSSLKDR